MEGLDDGRCTLSEGLRPDPGGRVHPAPDRVDGRVRPLPAQVGLERDALGPELEQEREALSELGHVGRIDHGDQIEGDAVGAQAVDARERPRVAPLPTGIDPQPVMHRGRAVERQEHARLTRGREPGERGVAEQGAVGVEEPAGHEVEAPPRDLLPRDPLRPGWSRGSPPTRVTLSHPVSRSSARARARRITFSLMGWLRLRPV